MSHQTELREVNIDTSLWLRVGDTYKLDVAYTPPSATIKDVIWESADTSVARVDKNGTVSAISIGTTKIRVTSKDGIKTDECHVSVSSFSSSVQGRADKIKVYPNPVGEGLLHIEQPYQEGVYIQLSDMNGRVLLSRRMTEEHMQISTSGFSPGPYLLHCKSKDHIVVQKVIIE